MKAKGKVVAAALAVSSIVTGLFVANVERGVAPTWTRDQAYETTATEWPGFKPGAGDLASNMEKAYNVLAEHRGGYRVKVLGEKYSHVRTLKDTLARAEVKLIASPMGTTVRVRAESDGFIWDSKVVDINPAMVIDTPGTDAVDIIVGTVVARFPKVHSMGIFVCKQISGSSTWSQHSWANAVDMGGPGDWGSDVYVAYIDKVVNYINKLEAKHMVPVSQVLWRGVANHYPGHVHFSGAPLMTGVPPCA